MSTENAEPKAPVDRLVMRCDLCRWWKPTEISQGVLQNRHPDDRDGTCYRYPPVLNVPAVQFDAVDDITDNPSAAIESAEESYHWVRPITDGNDFCGEFVSA